MKSIAFPSPLTSLKKAVAALCLMSLTLTPSASAAIINGVNFETAYFGDVLPNAAAPSWTIVGSAGVANAATQIYTVSTTGTQASYSERTLSMAGVNGVTIEFRANVSTMAGTLAAGDLRFYTGSEVFLFRLADDVVFFGNSVESASSYAISTDAMHTYRITLERQESGFLANLYIDHASTPVISGVAAGSSSTGARIQWGDTATSGGVNGTMGWNYVAYTTSGAYAPVPEPATTALLFGVGGGMLFLRQRRHARNA